MTLRVWGWSADNSGCQAYRIRYPIDAIRELKPDWVLGYGTVIPPEAKELAEVVVAQRTCNPGPSTLWQRWAKEGHKKLVYELDDDLWHVDPTNERPFYFFNEPKIRENIVRNIQVAHVVTVSTADLAQVVADETGHQNIHVVPNAVPAWLLRHKPEENHYLGWGGSPTHHGDFAQMRGALTRFLKHNPKLTFHCIGMNYAEWMRLNQDQCHFTKWIDSPEDFFKTIDYRVGIAPLRDTVFNRSKSDIKFLELAALGIPTVASDVAPYRSIVHGETGLLVKHDHEWTRHLKWTVDNPDGVEKMGTAAWRYVKDHRTTSHTAPLWVQAIES